MVQQDNIMKHTTYRQVFTKLLPEPYRSQAIANTINSGFCADDPAVFGNSDPDDIEDALLTAFTWCETPEGHGYWSEAARSQFPAAAALRLEAGKRYLTRDGRTAEVANEDICYASDSHYRFDGAVEGETGFCWSVTGRYESQRENPLDLVSEIVEPAVEETPATYRILEIGETIQEGDEVEGHDDWHPVRHYPVRCNIPDAFRRRVSESEASSPNPESRIADLESRIAVLEGLVVSPAVATPAPSAVDPGEGYRLLDIGEAILAGDEEADDEAGGGWSPICYPGDEFHPHNWYPVRRKIAPPTYRLLNPGEIIREGDELLDGVNRDGLENWRKVTTFRGRAFDPEDHFVTRRLVKSFEDA